MSRASRPRDGFSLLEVILALAILAMAIPMLGQLAEYGLASARRAEELAQATMACETIMAEIVAGIVEPATVAGAPYDGAWDENGESLFLYSVLADAADQTGMLRVTVIVESARGNDPITCDMTRLMIDPDFAASVAEEAAAAQPAE